MADWFVRPSGTIYGTGSGNSYTNAFSGFGDGFYTNSVGINWSVINKETDRLIICGTHNEGLEVYYINPISSNGFKIIGNYPNDRAIIDLRFDIPNWNVAESWVNESANIWYIGGITKNPCRLWVSGLERANVNTKVELSSTYIWWYDSINDRLYMYSSTNPSSSFSSIRGMMVLDDGTAANRRLHSGLRLYYCSNIHISNIEIIGGNYQSQFLGAHDCTLEYIKLRYGVSGFGLTENHNSGTYGSVTSDNNTIRYCIFDATADESNPTLTPDSTITWDAITLSSGANNNKIYNNVFKNYRHSAINLLAKADSTDPTFSVNNNEIFDNEISGIGGEYTRPFGTWGQYDGQCSGNKIYRNYIHDVNVRSQIGGDNNEIYENIFMNISNSRSAIAATNTGQAISLNSYTNNTSIPGFSKNNKIYRNRIENTASAGIDIRCDRASTSGYIFGNSIYDNTLINCGTQAIDNVNLTESKFAAIHIVVTDYNTNPEVNKIHNNNFTNNLIWNSSSDKLISYHGNNGGDFHYTLPEWENNSQNNDYISGNRDCPCQNC